MKTGEIFFYNPGETQYEVRKKVWSRFKVAKRCL